MIRGSARVTSRVKHRNHHPERRRWRWGVGRGAESDSVPKIWGPAEFKVSFYPVG